MSVRTVLGGMIALLGLLVTSAHGQAISVDRVARLLERGDAHRSRGDVVSALGFYRDAIAIAPRRSQGYVALGELYLQLGEGARALEVFEAGARNAGQGDALWLGFARALRASGNHERALDALRSLRNVEPASASGLVALAEALEERGSFLEALSVRRARLTRLESAADEEAASRERAHIRALELILGPAERTGTRARCAQPEASAVRRALARCP